MIEKMIQLRGIGLLHNALPAGALCLKRVTVIYAENGRGKSTFAAICRSLATGDGQVIEERRTIGGTLAPTVHFRINNQSYQFHNGEWSNPYPNIVVFDDHFVETNVCIGSRIEPPQRENLLEFAIGEQGVRLKGEIDKINENIEAVNRELKNLGQVISQHKGPLTLEQFIQLKPAPDVDVRLKEIQQQLQHAENVEAIRKRPVPECIQLPEFDLSRIEQLLAGSLETVAEKAERKVKEHVARHLDADGEKWLRQGLGYLEKTAICPFCGQNVRGLDLVEAYKQYFSKAYDDFKCQIEQALHGVEKQLGESIWASIEGTLRLNRSAEGAWADKPDLKFPEDLDLNTLRSIFTALRDGVLAVLKQKLSAPLSNIPVPEALHQVTKQYATVRTQVERYNKAVESVRLSIRKLKDSLGTVDKQQLRNEIERLEAEKRRSQPEVDDYCHEYQELQKKKSELENSKSQKRQKLDSYTDELLQRYKDEINNLLRKFNAGFTISEMGVRHVKGTPRTEYGLKVMGKTISVSSQSGREFSATLSSGDRKTLALAFFLARLKLDPQLNQRIVIIDDPVSSLDAARRRATCDELAKLAQKCAQLIVLSHDALFLRDLLQRVNYDQDNLISSLRLRREGKYSIIEECDIFRICREEYYEIYESLVQYLEKGPVGDKARIAENIRKYLEHNLRNRFPTELEGSRNLGEMIRRIRSEPTRFGRLVERLDDLTKLNDFSSPYAHLASDRPLPPPDAELRQMVELALEIGRGG
ncbi:AAA family ATPase [Candidatus Bipolaricaulota bacterium]|nr:AAA family ATPase [Candidatus Bipolaricaulota bacterium]